MTEAEQETPATHGKDTGNLSEKKQRKPLFNLLYHVLAVSTKKFDMEKASNSDRQKWARIIISACAAYGDLLKDVELESIEDRLTILERQQEKQVLENFR